MTFFKARYDCYGKYLGIKYDRDFCNIVTETEIEFYECLDQFKIQKKADYCLFKYPKSLFLLGGNSSFHDCL